MMSHCAQSHSCTISDNSQNKYLEQRLIRLETKLVRGFEEMGINIDSDQDWIRVDEANARVYMRTMSRSMKVLLATMQRLGARRFGEEYKLFVNNNYFGSILFKDPSKSHTNSQEPQHLT